MERCDLLGKTGKWALENNLLSKVIKLPFAVIHWAPTEFGKEERFYMEINV